MTRVGVVSDTHLPRFGRALPRALVAGLRRAGVTRVLHCGDLTDPLAAGLFEAQWPFDAVAGNNDDKALHRRFGDRKILTIEDVRVGMIHGDGKRGTTRGRARAAFTDNEADVILFGHSHIPLVARDGAVIIGNPGSPTDKRMNPLYSWALLTIDGRIADLRLRFYASRALEE